MRNHRLGIDRSMTSRRFAIAVLLIASPGAAQDLTPINPADWARPNVMVEGMRAAPAAPPARTARLSPDSIRTCRNAARMTGRDATHRRKLAQLRALCRRGGYTPD